SGRKLLSPINKSVNESLRELLEELTLESNEGDEHSPKSSEGSNVDMGEQQQQPSHNTLQTLAQPVIGPVTSCIRLPDPARNYELKMIHYNQLPAFHGLPSKDPLNFIRKFYNVLNTFPLNGLSGDQLKMRCFPETLKDRAKAWFITLAPASLTTWTEVYTKFIGRYYSHQKTQELRSQIVSFAQLPSEPLHEAWERFKDLQLQCPHHNLSPGLLMNCFYDSLNQNLQYMVDNAVGGDIGEKTAEEMYEIFETMSANSSQKSNRGKRAVVNEAASAMQHDLPKKERDLGGFVIRIALGNRKEASGMLDLGAGINLMPFSIFQRLGLGYLRPTRMCLQLADHLIRYPKGVVEDVLVRIGKLIVPVDFVVLDVGDIQENGKDHTILLGRPFMATTNTLIDVRNGTLNMTVLGESVSISVREATSASSVNFVEECVFVDVSDP
ncbi:Unknown protein, partial [Striga hermonthica]